MNPNWAEENLQTIRTLMERSALYRRALAPIMIFCGCVGIIGGIIGWLLQINSPRGFVLFWTGIATVALVGTFILVRRQALKDSEPFWSPPTKRVTQALIPSFSVGAFIAVIIVRWIYSGDSVVVLIPVWCWTFGCAVHSAGFFMPRGMKLFGWLFILTGCLRIIDMLTQFSPEWFNGSPDLLMGGIFGGLHLAYGIYLYYTEKKNSAL